MFLIKSLKAFQILLISTVTSAPTKTCTLTDKVASYTMNSVFFNTSKCVLFLLSIYSLVVLNLVPNIAACTLHVSVFVAVPLLLSLISFVTLIPTPPTLISN